MSYLWDRTSRERDAWGGASYLSEEILRKVEEIADAPKLEAEPLEFKGKKTPYTMWSWHAQNKRSYKIRMEEAKIKKDEKIEVEENEEN